MTALAPPPPAPAPAPAPIDPAPAKPRVPRFLRIGFEVILVAVALVILYVVLSFAVVSNTWRAAIPASCQQPSTVDYSKVGPPAYPPYSVKFTTWHDLPWAESSDANVGHHQTVDDRVVYGDHVKLESTDIDHFECRWTNAGVTIVEPALPGQHAGIEHFVPAERFLGGR